MSRFQSGKPADFRYRPVNDLIDNWPKLDLKYRDVLVMVALWRKAEYKTNMLVKVTLERLAKALKMPVSSLTVSLNRIEAVGLISRRRGGGGRTTEYTIKSLRNSNTKPHKSSRISNSKSSRISTTFQKSLHCPAKNRVDGGYPLNGDDSLATLAFAQVGL